MSRNRYYRKLNEDQKEAILELFFNSMDNGVPTIAEKTGIPEHWVHKVIDNELKRPKHEEI